MKIHILADNIARKRGILAEHGLSLFIEREAGNILFDTGQSSVYCHNANILGIDLKRTDYVVFSHGHYDHCGGAECLATLSIAPKLYIHPQALCRRYKKGPEETAYTDIGIPWSPAYLSAAKKQFVYNEKTRTIGPGLHLLSGIPYATDFEGAPQGLFMENAEGKIVPDLFEDEQILVMETKKGLVLILGCSHPGIVNALKYVQQLFPGPPIYALLAGMHMEKADPARVEKTAWYIRDLGIRRVVPLHCTGVVAICEMKRILKDRCSILAAGDTWAF